MTKHHFFYPLLGLALLCCGVYIARQEISQARAEERSKASAERQQALDQQKKQNDADLKSALSVLEAARSKPATVQAVTKYTSTPMPQGSQLEIFTPGADCANCVDSKPFLQLKGDPQKNLQWIQGMELDHAECDKKLDNCQKNSVIADGKLKDMTADRDNWKNTAKGGSKWHRALKIAKCGAVAGGGAGLGALLGKSKGAAIGGFAGSAGCAIFW